MVPSGVIHVIVSDGISFFLWLNGVYLYGYTTFFLTILGHLGCLPVLATVGGAAVNMGCRYPFKIVISFPLNKYPKVGLLDHRLSSPGRASVLLSILAAPFSNPTNNVQ